MPTALLLHNPRQVSFLFFFGVDQKADLLIHAYMFYNSSVYVTAVSLNC